MPEESLIGSLDFIFKDSRAVCVSHLHGLGWFMVPQNLALCLGQFTVVQVNLAFLRAIFLKLLRLTERFLVSRHFILVFFELYLIMWLCSLVKCSKQICSHLEV